MLCHSLGTSAFCCLQPQEPSREPLVTSWSCSGAASHHADVLGSWSRAGLHRPGGEQAQAGGTRAEGQRQWPRKCLAPSSSSQSGTWRSHTALTVISCSSSLERHHPCSHNDAFMLQPVVYLNLRRGQPTLRSVGIVSSADTCFPKIAPRKVSRWWREFTSCHQSSQGREGLEGRYHLEL